MTRVSTAIACASLLAFGPGAAHAAGDHHDDPLHALMHLFQSEALVGEPSLVDCTLSGGRKTECVAITVKGGPVDHGTGPWCPRHIEDGAEAGGIWLEGGEKYDVSGAFIAGLDAFYGDPVWQLFDPETGKVRVTDTAEACAAAARPQVDAKYNNYCVECELSYMDKTTTRTYVLPLNPEKSNRPSPARGGALGVALNGVRIDGPAPVDAILGAHTLAPFDDCGGHVNPHDGYHYHAATGCSAKVAVADGHAPIIGLAMDGYRLHARVDLDGTEPDDLDACRGHVVEGLGYHYHANTVGSNAILPCLTGQTGCALEGEDADCDATKRVRRGPPPDGRRPPPGADGMRRPPPGASE